MSDTGAFITDDGPSDAELVERCLRGERTAFDQLTRRYLRPAIATALEYTQSLADAEDVVQDAFLRALRALGRFDRSRPFAPWFFTILRNAGKNHAARDGRWRIVPVPEDIPARQPDPAERLARGEIQRSLEVGVEHLTPMQRACFRLCDVEGFTSTEASRMLGIGDATVRVHVHRARATLRELLRPLVDEQTTP